MNALNAGMAAAMLEQLTDWADDDGVATVLVQRRRGARAVRRRRHRGHLRGHADGRRFEPRTSGRTEYQLNALIAGYPKPYVAFMDGLVLGGGVGISAHGSVRVVTERTRTGMPETTIGFVPDVGGTLLLSRSPGEAGTHAALTGAHLSGADALFLGLADHFVPSGSLPALAAALESRSGGGRRRTLHRKSRRPRPWRASGTGSTPATPATTRRRSSAACVPLIGRRGAAGEAADAADTIEAKSPTAVKVALESLRRVRGLSLEEALDQEYRVGLRCLAGPDFREGIRAQVVDKDRNPQWKPATLHEVPRPTSRATLSRWGSGSSTLQSKEARNV